ncbi:FeoB-associated Cys-rich membrane protein [uncultured Clostridium sp.]|uniref:FeoB-associated Cys-rich membrane protein n=1 Tax=uncultured Clostridium sp. TaxID=59620 RepID=UPI0025D42F53|nr:FeoB-associated Cys-rich membrane protein [uncultured Clostridium sp.]
MSTIIIGTLVIGSMIYIAFRKIKKARKGESSCGCGCSGCSKSKSCHEITINK